MQNIGIFAYSMKRPKNKSNHSPTAKKGVRAEIIPSEEGIVMDEFIKHIEQKEPVLNEAESTARNKARFLKAYTSSLMSVTKACEQANISRGIYYVWMKEDPAFKQAVIDAEESQGNIVEDALMDLIRERDPSSVRFYLDRRVPKYKPKQILEHHVGDKTLEDLLDEDKATPNGTDTPSTDRGTDQDPKQTEGNSSLPLEHSAEVLLGSQDASEPDPES